MPNVILNFPENAITKDGSSYSNVIKRQVIAKFPFKFPFPIFSFCFRFHKQTFHFNAFPTNKDCS